MEDRETVRMRKYGASKTTRIMMATVPHVTSGLGLRKFQTDGFLLTRVYLMWVQLWLGTRVLGKVERVQGQRKIARILMTRATYHLLILAFKILPSCGPTDLLRTSAHETTNSHSLSRYRHYAHALSALKIGDSPHVTTANCRGTRIDATHNFKSK